jgi:2-hydroxy-3-keto-5-methylthiopentenyl-1-phosphate phosphatase
MRDKIGDHEDWKDGHDAFRQNTVIFVKEATKMFESLHNRINELELIIEERQSSAKK